MSNLIINHPEAEAIRAGVTKALAALGIDAEMPEKVKDNIVYFYSCPGNGVEIEFCSPVDTGVWTEQFEIRHPNSPNVFISVSRFTDGPDARSGKLWHVTTHVGDNDKRLVPDRLDGVADPLHTETGLTNVYVDHARELTEVFPIITLMETATTLLAAYAP